MQRPPERARRSRGREPAVQVPMTSSMRQAVVLNAVPLPSRARQQAVQCCHATPEVPGSCNDPVCSRGLDRASGRD